MQGVEISIAIGRQMYDLGIDDQGLTKTGRFPDNARIALRPVGAVPCVEPHAAVTDMDL
jgi:hypothetical protein